jgi:hypothetical protein
MQTRAERAAALFEKLRYPSPNLDELAAGFGIIREQSEFIGDAIHLIQITQTGLILKIIFKSGIQTSIHFGV